MKIDNPIPPPPLFTVIHSTRTSYMADFSDLYFSYRFAGRSKADAVAAAEAETGQTCVAELWRKSHEMGALFEEFNLSTRTATKTSLRRRILKRADELYATDTLCDECMSWLLERIVDVVPTKKKMRRDYRFNHVLCCWYEAATKQIRKSGCDKCPWHQRENTEWRAKHPLPVPQ